MDDRAETRQDRLRGEVRRTYEDCVAMELSCWERSERVAAMRVRLALMRDKLDAMRDRLDARLTRTTMDAQSVRATPE